LCDNDLIIAIPVGIGKIFLLSMHCFTLTVKLLHLGR